MAEALANELARLEAVFRDTPDAELHDTDIAELTGLDEDQCRTLLGKLRETGAIEERRNRVYVGQTSDRTSAAGGTGSTEF
jgi:transcription initiation factor IIE alpha subunit